MKDPKSEDERGGEDERRKAYSDKVNKFLMPIKRIKETLPTILLHVSLMFVEQRTNFYKPNSELLWVALNLCGLKNLWQGHSLIEVDDVFSHTSLFLMRFQYKLPELRVRSHVMFLFFFRDR